MLMGDGHQAALPGEDRASCFASDFSEPSPERSLSRTKTEPFVVLMSRT